MALKILTAVSFLLIIGLIAVSLKKKDLVIKEIDDRFFYIVFVLMLFAFSSILLIRIDKVPMALNVDEAGGAYDALNIARYGTDRYLNRYPMHFPNFGGGGQSALYNYLAAFLFNFFDFSPTVFRIPAVFMSLLSAAFMTLTVKKEKGKLTALIIMFLFAVLPFSIMHSRWGLDCYMLYPVTIIASTIFYLALSKKRLYLFVISGFLYGFCFYTYAIAYLFIFIFISSISLYLLFTKNIRWSELFAFGIPIFIMAIPPLLMLAVNARMLNQINLSFITIPKLSSYRVGEVSFSNVFDNIGIDFLFTVFSWDYLVQNSIMKFGTLYYFSIPLVLYGFVMVHIDFVKSVKKREINLDSIIVFLFWSMLLTVLLLKSPNINRINPIYISLIYFLCIGIEKVCSKAAMNKYAILVMYLLFFGLFMYDYHCVYPAEFKDNDLYVSMTDLKKALDYVSDKKSDHIYVIGGQQPYIYTVLALDTDAKDFVNNKEDNGHGEIIRYDRYRFCLDEEIPDNSIIIYTKEYEIPDDIDTEYKKTRFNTVSVYEHK